MDDKVEPKKMDAQQVVTFMTTEHFTLQTARSATISDANGRCSLFLSTLSSAIVALAFIGQVSNMGETFLVFSLVLFPSLFFIGLVTFARVLQTGIEDNLYAREINRIRHYYLELAPEVKKYFVMSASDDMPATLQNMGVISPKWQLFFTSAGMVGVINSVILGVFGGMLAKTLLDLPLTVNVVLGIIIFAVSVGLHLIYQMRQWNRTEAQVKVMFPVSNSPRSVHDL